jgi:hypothetical protein
VAINSHLTDRTLEELPEIAGADSQWRCTVFWNDSPLLVFQGILVAQLAVYVDLGVALRILLATSCIDCGGAVYPCAGYDRVVFGILEVAAVSLTTGTVKGINREAVWPRRNLGVGLGVVLEWVRSGGNKVVMSRWISHAKRTVTNHTSELSIVLFHSSLKISLPSTV